MGVHVNQVKRFVVGVKRSTFDEQRARVQITVAQVSPAPEVVTTTAPFLV